MEVDALVVQGMYCEKLTAQGYLGTFIKLFNSSSVLIISSNCCTTDKLLEFTCGDVLRACPVVDGKAKKRTTSQTFIVNDDEKAGENKILLYRSITE
jgi:hypothetical protein